MLHLVHAGEHACIHRMSGERLERGRPNEIQCRRGWDHPDIVTGFGEFADQMAGFVRGDTACDTNDDITGGVGVLIGL